ncbi:MAG: UDP-N-acetylmuramoyl-tripeptide--D-alanyl-D-alanine ligase [Acidobacteria bacterium]|nr:UDP-N-acetylmuramoyl-tripeptide--D-alanyl-D-alanine ligase [Acidobacteriota bacterium]
MKLPRIPSRIHRALLYPVAWIWRTLMFRTTFIAITGSVGKTTAKEALAEILGEGSRIVKTQGNWNNMKDVLGAVLSVRPWHRYAVIEAPSSGPGWMKRTAWLLRPDIAVVTRVLRTHLNRFADEDDIARDKGRLVAAVPRGGLVVLNGDDARVAAMAARTRARVVRFGTGEGADVRGEAISSSWPGRLVMRVFAGGVSSEARTRLVGAHWVTSITAAVAVAHACGISLEQSARALARLEPYAGRMQPAEVPCGAVFIRDEQNGSIDTMVPALDVLRSAQAGRKLVILSDVSDSSVKQKRRVPMLARQAAGIADVAIFVGDHARRGLKAAVAAGMAPESVHEFVAIDRAAEFVRSELRAGDLVLLKGRATDHLSRIFHYQMGPVSCWKSRCGKTMLCDFCPDLTRPPTPLRTAPRAAQSDPEDRDPLQTSSAPV